MQKMFGRKDNADRTTSGDNDNANLPNLVTPQLYSVHLECLQITLSIP